MGGWLALIVYTLICFTVFFFAVIRLVGNSEKSIWGLVPVGIEALIAGAASPSSMFLLAVLVYGNVLRIDRDSKDDQLRCCDADFETNPHLKPRQLNG